MAASAWHRRLLRRRHGADAVARRAGDRDGFIGSATRPQRHEECMACGRDAALAGTPPNATIAARFSGALILRISNKMSNLIADLTSDLQQIHVLWQLGVLLFCIGAAWQLQRVYRHMVIRRADVDGTLTLGVGSVQRLLFPLSALALMLFGRWLLHHWQPVNLLNLA